MNFLREVVSIPFGYIISFFYNISGNYILSLLLVTILVKLILLPFSVRQQKSMAKSQRLQPKIRRIREKYANNQQKMQEEMNALYQREGYSSMTGGCSNTIVMMIVMLGLSFVNYKTLSYVLRIPTDTVNTITALAREYGEAANLKAAELTDFRIELTAITHWNEFDHTGISQDVIAKIDEFIKNFSLFGVSLSETPNVHMGATLLWLIPILTGVLSLTMGLYTYLRQRKTNPEMAKNPSMGCMTLMSPIMSVWFSFLFPASVGVYIIMSTFLSLVQMIILNHTHSPKKVLARLMVEETIQHRAREKVLKNVAQETHEDK